MVRKRKKKSDIIIVNKVKILQSLWDKLSKGTQRRIYHFVEIIKEEEKKDESQ